MQSAARLFPITGELSISYNSTAAINIRRKLFKMPKGVGSDSQSYEAGILMQEGTIKRTRTKLASCSL